MAWEWCVFTIAISSLYFYFASLYENGTIPYILNIASGYLLLISGTVGLTTIFGYYCYTKLILIIELLKLLWSQGLGQFILYVVLVIIQLLAQLFVFVVLENIEGYIHFLVGAAA